MCCRRLTLRIVLTNDDGVYAPGLWAAAEALRELGEVVVIAPDRDMSGVGTAMTLMNVVRVQDIPSPVQGIKAYSVQGTPADCVILGSEKLLDGTPDLVVSGINRGANLGTDVMVSGTVGGAFQGYFRHIPSMAVSVVYETDAPTSEALEEKSAALDGLLRALGYEIEVLPDSYPGAGWSVRHAMATHHG